MRRLIGAVRRRASTIAATAIVTGGLAVSAVALPGTALADSQVPTDTSISWTHQWQQAAGTFALQVGVSVTSESASSGAPDGTVEIIVGSSHCWAGLNQGSGLTSTGSCWVGNLNPGTYPVQAGYQGSAMFAASSSAAKWVNVGGAPVPAANIRTHLNCTPRVHVRQTGQCTLWVSNVGGDAANHVWAQISLPWQFQSLWCRPGWICRVHNHTASVYMGTVWAGQTRTLQVFFRTGWGWGLWQSSARTVTAYGQTWWSWNGNRYHDWSSAQIAIVPRWWSSR